MQKYLTQHRLNAFTIRLPRDLQVYNQTGSLIEKGFSAGAAASLINHFADFIQSNLETGYNNLPVFNFLSSFYDVEFVKEDDESVEFNLLINEVLNKSMWLRFKHTVYNQYNALIGFSEILREVENTAETEGLLIERINDNARNMYKNTTLLMDYEQMKNFNFELKARSVQPLEYLSSYLHHRHDTEEQVSIDFLQSELENIELNIENDLFKTSLDLFFDSLQKIVQLSYAKFQIDAKLKCNIGFESSFNANDDKEFPHEIQMFNDFFERGIDFNNLSNRLFHFFYIRLVAEKLGGEFSIEIDETQNHRLIAQWTFPIVNSGIQKNMDIASYQSFEEGKKKFIALKSVEEYSVELRKEISDEFHAVEYAYVLDDWKMFADKLDRICSKNKVQNESALKQLVQNIRQAVDAFDVTSLHLIATKLKQISNAD